MITCTFEKGYKSSLRHVVVHAICEKDNSILLVKRSPKISEGGKWGLPGGFLDRGETAREGAVRELLEETGWRGEVISLFKIDSRPDRPCEDRQNVAFDFLVKPIKKVNESDWESTKTELIPIEKLFNFDKFAFDHGETIRLYLKYRKEKFSLPIVH